MSRPASFSIQKILIAVFFISAVITFAIPCASLAQEAAARESAARQQLEAVKLSPPDLNKGASLMQALNNRKTTRDLIDKKLSEKHLSELLWAANGVNRTDGKRTSPAAINIQAIDIYVVMEQGTYVYDAEKSQLTPVVKGDFRKQTGFQSQVAIAPVNLVFVGNPDKFNRPGGAMSTSADNSLSMIYITCGCMMQNVALYCAAENIGCGVRAYIDADVFGKAVNLKSGQKVLCAETIGYPK